MNYESVRKDGHCPISEVFCCVSPRAIQAVDLKMPSARLVILSAPSGAGKTSLARALTESMPHFHTSISHTTRPMRDFELDGVDFFFIDRSKFEQMIDADQFLEYAHVFGHLYGTAKAPIHASLDLGQNIVLDIDWQGARKVRAAMPNALSVFILPPSLRELERRLIDRKDTSEAIRHRMREALNEINHYKEFDFVIVNHNFDVALEELRDILLGHKSPRSSQGFDLTPFLQPEKNCKL